VSNRSEDAIRLFKGYAILEVGVPVEVVEEVSEIDSNTRQHLMADKYIRGLLREEGEGKRIYHAILADYILEQIGEDEKKEYHSRAVEVYRGKLEKAEKEQIRPDALAAMRLAEHVLAVEGKEAFVYACAYETYIPLQTLGLLDVALEISMRALDMVREDSKEQAAVLCIIGLIYRNKGNFDEAEKMHFMALKIEKEGNREEGMALEYGNLGVIYQIRGELDKAEEMHKKSLEIEKKLWHLEGMASEYGNLGNIYRMRSDFEKAKKMYNRVLEIEEKLGRPDSIALAYGNLGLIYKTRGELDKAEEMHLKSLKIKEKLGLQQGISISYGNLGNVYYMRGELNKAEKMHKKALEIDEKIDNLEGVARHSSNLGLVYQKRGDIGKAKEYWEQALGLYKKIGMPHRVEKVEGWIEGLKDK
jgi:tetratricopeptide (TPR) repeat protein